MAGNGLWWDKPYFSRTSFSYFVLLALFVNLRFSLNLNYGDCRCPQSLSLFNRCFTYKGWAYLAWAMGIASVILSHHGHHIIAYILHDNRRSSACWRHVKIVGFFVWKIHILMRNETICNRKNTPYGVTDVTLNHTKTFRRKHTCGVVSWLVDCSWCSGLNGQPYLMQF